MGTFYDLRGYLSGTLAEVEGVRDRVEASRLSHQQSEAETAILLYLQGWVFEAEPSEPPFNAFFGADMRYSGVEFLQDSLSAIAADFPDMSGCFYLDKDDGETSEIWYVGQGQLAVEPRQSSSLGTDVSPSETSLSSVVGFLDCDFEEIPEVEAVVRSQQESFEGQIRWHFQREPINYSAHAFLSAQVELEVSAVLESVLARVVEQVPEVSGATFAVDDTGRPNLLWQVSEGHQIWPVGR